MSINKNWGDTNEPLKKGSAKFPIEDVRQRQGPGGIMLDYIPIERVLARLGDIDPGYEIEKRTEAITQDGNKWTIFVAVDLVMFSRNVAGVGSGTSNDPDMAYKTAMSEAIKNAAKNGWHVGLYLWDEDERALVAEQRLGGSRKGVKAPAQRVKSRKPVESDEGIDGFEG